MATFAAWLSEQKERDDQVGALGKWWTSLEGKRPRRSAPQGVLGVLRDHDRSQWDQWGRQALDQAKREYNELMGIVATEQDGDVTRHPELIMKALADLDAKVGMIMIHLGVGKVPAADLAEVSPGPALAAEALDVVRNEAGWPPRAWPDLYAIAEFGDEEGAA